MCQRPHLEFRGQLARASALTSWPSLHTYVMKTRDQECLMSSDDSVLQCENQGSKIGDLLILFWMEDVIHSSVEYQAE